MGKSKNQLQAEIDALKTELEVALEATMDDRNKELAGQVETLSAEIETLSAEIETLTEANTSLDEENKEMSTKIVNLVEENDELIEASANETIDDLISQVASLTDTVEELETAPAAAAVNLAKVKGFTLAVDDPFGKGVLRTYLANSKNPSGQAASLPFVLPFNDVKATTIALDDYIVRASGGCDNARADAARAAKAKL